MSSFLAPEANGYVAQYNGRKILVFLTGMGWNNRLEQYNILHQLFLLKLCIYHNLYFVETPKDLIRKLLVVEASQRITVKEALQHEFFQVVVSYCHKIAKIVSRIVWMSNPKWLFVFSTATLSHSMLESLSVSPFYAFVVQFGFNVSKKHLNHYPSTQQHSILTGSKRSGRWG